MKIIRGLNKYIGLMFRTIKTEPIVFEFNHPVEYAIHSYFVFFPFRAIWTFEDGSIEERIVKPFSYNIKPSKPFTKLIEIPITEDNKLLQGGKDVETKEKAS